MPTVRERRIALSRAVLRGMDSIPPLLWVIAFFAIVSILTWFRVAPYGGNLSALITLQAEFAEANPAARFPGLVVLRESGYDGQFFYLLARYLFDADMPMPILDTYTMRMGRIGMSALCGLVTSFFGWQHYPLVTLVLLNGLAALSYLALRSLLPGPHRWMAILYLFSAFSLNATLLLVSDSLMVSLALLAVFALERAGFRISEDATDTASYTSAWMGTALLLLIALVFVRDTALFVIAPIGLLSLWRRSVRGAILAAIPVLIYIGWTGFVKGTEVHPGAHPAHYMTKFDLPLRGFFQSLEFSRDASLRTLARETSKFLNMGFVVLLVLALRRVRSIVGLILVSPILFAVGLSLVATREYWDTFDNVSRMFALSLPWAILLRGRLRDFRPDAALAFSVGLFFLFCVRLVWLKTALAYDVVGL